MVFHQPTSNISKNAKADAQDWRDRLCELIASDPKRVQAIMDFAQRKVTNKSDGFTPIELSRVLVIVGLIVGGALLGYTVMK